MTGGCPELNPPEIHRNPPNIDHCCKRETDIQQTDENEKNENRLAQARWFIIVPIDPYCDIYRIVISIYLFTHMHTHTHIYIYYIRYTYIKNKGTRNSFWALHHWTKRCEDLTVSFAVRDLQGHASSWWGWGRRDWVNLDESLREWFWVYIYIHIHIYSICQLYTCIQTYMHAYIYICIYICIYIHIHTHTYTYTYYT